MITFERFLELFCKKARIKYVSLAKTRQQIRLNFTELCHKDIINGVYIKKYKVYFERLNVFYNIGNCTEDFPSKDENVCIFVENNPGIIISKKAKAYCVNSSIGLFENAKACCIRCDIRCFENSKVIAYKCDNITMHANTKGLFKCCSDITAECNATIKLLGNCIAYAINNAVITASEMCYVAATDDVKITAKQYTYALIYKNATVEADETCSIKCV